MSDNIVLYRGDSTKIKEFSLKKANKFCLLGKGIYLTNKPSVAQTYRMKGSSLWHLNTTVEAKDKPQAIKMILWTFYLCRFYQKDEKLVDLFKRIIKDPKATARVSRIEDLKPEILQELEKSIYRQLEDGSITMTRGSKVNGKQSFTFQEDSSSIGWTTKFVFPEPYFTRNCVNFDAVQLDEGFLQILEDQRFWKDTRMEYLKDGSVNEWDPYLKFQNQRRPAYGTTESNRRLRLDSHGIRFDRLIPVLVSYGIHGFEYSGGARMGGYGYHRAFSIFDEQYVNDHRVERRK